RVLCRVGCAHHPSRNGRWAKPTLRPKLSLQTAALAATELPGAEAELLRRDLQLSDGRIIADGYRRLSRGEKCVACAAGWGRKLARRLIGDGRCDRKRLRLGGPLSIGGRRGCGGPG